jgi:urease subunit gamma/beta
VITPAVPDRYDARAMRLIPWEEERLQLFAAAELARRHRDAGLALNQPEAVAIICDAMLEAARAGASYAGVENAGRWAVDPGEVMDGVRELLDEVRLEVLLADGSRLVVLVDPLARPDGVEPGARDGEAGPGPGATLTEDQENPEADAADRETLELVVRSTSRRPVRVSSHYPFERVNARLEFDREAAAGFRLDLPAGSYAAWAPGESKAVRLVRYGGSGR